MFRNFEAILIKRYFFSCRFESIKTASSLDPYQFIHKSDIPTYHFQKSLRRLPIPKLEDSCGRYLNAIQAIFGENNEFKETEKNVKLFLDGEGPGKNIQKKCMFKIYNGNY